MVAVWDQTMIAAKVAVARVPPNAVLAATITITTILATTNRYHHRY